MTISEDAIMIFHGHPVTLAQYRLLKSYELREPWLLGMFSRIARWGSNRAAGSRKKAAARLMRSLGVEPASLSAGRTSNALQDGQENLG